MSLPQSTGTWLDGRRRSFVYAFYGLKILFREKNAQIHSAAAVIVVGAGFLLGVSRVDWLFLTGAITSVLVTEALNTALESIANAAVPEVHPLIKTGKDVAAGAVLLAAIGAACIGLLVFVPRIGQLFR